MKKTVILLLTLVLLLGSFARAETLKDAEKLSTFLQSCRAGELESFTFDTTEAFCDRLLANDCAVLNALLRSGGVEGYSWESRGGTFTFSDVTYLPGTLFGCESEADVLEAFTSGADQFCLLMTEELYEKMSANDFARLYELQGLAGLKSDGFSYYEESAIVLYSSAEQLTGETLEDLQSARLYIESCAAELADTIELRCSAELYEILPSAMDDLTSNAGIYYFSYRLDPYLRTATLYVEDYYPGTKMVRGEDACLTDRERAACREARALAEACGADTPLQTARNIHDALCERITYETLEGKTENDTAVGALLNGRADCDGYADAFFAVASFAGLEVRMQHGFTDGTTDSGHMWNLMRIDGTWRAVDVTWDDQAFGALDDRFNIGEDLLSRTHSWNHDATVELAGSVAADSVLISDDLALAARLALLTAAPFEFETDADYGAALTEDEGWSRLRRVGLLCGMDEIQASVRESLTGYTFRVESWTPTELPVTPVADAAALENEMQRLRDAGTTEFALLPEGDAAEEWQAALDEWLCGYSYSYCQYPGFVYVVVREANYY